MAQEVAGGRSGRFRARADALGAPKLTGDRLVKFHFSSKIQDFGVF